MSRTTKRPQGAYAYMILVDQVARYLGKGRGKRAWSHETEARRINEGCPSKRARRATFFHHQLAAALRSGAAVEVNIIHSGMSDAEAFEYEKNIVAEAKPMGQLWNTSDGGFGRTSADAKRQWQSAEFKARITAQRRKWWDSDESYKRPVITPNGNFKSTREAARALGIPIGTAASRTIQQLCGWRYADAEPMQPKMVRGNPRRVITPNGEFPSAVAASKAHGMAYSVGFGRAQQQRHGWRFANEEIRPPKKRRTSHNARPVATPQGTFASATAAAKAHGINHETARWRADTQLYGWHYVGEELRHPHRPHGWIRPVITPQGTFPMTTAAAAAYGVSQATAWYRAKHQKQGWRFADEEIKILPQLDSMAPYPQQ